MTSRENLSSRRASAPSWFGMGETSARDRSSRSDYPLPLGEVAVNILSHKGLTQSPAAQGPPTSTGVSEGELPKSPSNFLLLTEPPQGPYSQGGRLEVLQITLKKG